MRLVSRRSRPAIRVRYRLGDGTDGINETFEFWPMSSSKSAYNFQGWTEMKNTGNETAVEVISSNLFFEHVSP